MLKMNMRFEFWILISIDPVYITIQLPPQSFVRNKKRKLSKYIHQPFYNANKMKPL